MVIPVETSNRKTIARAALWAEAVILIVVGSIMTSVRSFIAFDYVDEGNGVTTATNGVTVEIWPIGLALLCVGLLTITAVLVIEALRPAAPAR
jgi:hypothetical protein